MIQLKLVLKNIKVNKQNKLKYIHRYEKKGQELKGTIASENLYPKNLNIEGELPIYLLLDESKFIAAKLYSLV